MTLVNSCRGRRGSQLFDGEWILVCASVRQCALTTAAVGGWAKWTVPPGGRLGRFTGWFWWHRRFGLSYRVLRLGLVSCMEHVGLVVQVRRLRMDPCTGTWLSRDCGVGGAGVARVRAGGGRLAGPVQVCGGRW
ncbi:hypothetical protein CS0771_60960 [Catellatospora sp. IY07-71]|nr:hypothetical protein CS0771_60960 [Catellatospora sp. IY07-71]